MQLVEVVRIFHQKGWSQATSTNYSFRDLESRDRIWISASGFDKSGFDKHSLLELQTDGTILGAAPGLKPSAETQLHLMLYEKPEINCVMHTHSLEATVLSRITSNKELIFQGYETQKSIQGVPSHDSVLRIPIYENTQDIAGLRKLITTDWPDLPVFGGGFIIKGHGLYTWGESIFAAKRHIEGLEFLISCQLEELRLKR